METDHRVVLLLRLTLGSKTIARRFYDSPSSISQIDSIAMSLFPELEESLDTQTNEKKYLYFTNDGDMIESDEDLKAVCDVEIDLNTSLVTFLSFGCEFFFFIAHYSRKKEREIANLRKKMKNKNTPQTHNKEELQYLELRIIDKTIVARGKYMNPITFMIQNAEKNRQKWEPLLCERI